MKYPFYIFIVLFFLLINPAFSEIVTDNSIYWGSDIFLDNDNEWHYNSEYNPNLINMGTYWTTQEPTGLQGRFYDDGRICFGQDIDHYLGMQPLGIFYVNYFNLTQRTILVDLTGSTLAVNDNIVTYTKGTVSIEFINSFKQIKGNIYMPNSAPICLIPNCALAVVWEIVDSKGINTDDGDKSTWWFDNAKAAFPIGDIYNNGSKDLTKKIFRQDGKIYLVEGVGYNWISDIYRTDSQFIFDPSIKWNVTTAWSDWIGTLREHGDVKLRLPPNNTEGELAAWTFEAQTGNTVHDVSGTGKYGTFTDELTGNWTALGKYEGAWIGDGVNDYISTTYQNDLDDIFSISVWINISDILLNTNSILGVYTSSSNYWVLRHRADKGGVTLQHTTGASAGYTTPSKNMVQDQWTNIVLVKSNATNVKIYQDGELITNESLAYTGYTSNNLNFGTLSGASNFIIGKLDEIYIYNRELTNDEINKTINNYHIFVSYRNNSVVQDFTIGLVGKYLNVSGTHAANVTLSATAKFSSDNITWTGDTSINSSFSLNDNVIVSLANEYRYWKDINITMTTTYQPETDIISSITITSAELPSPTIINYTPVTPIRSHEGDNQTFSITVDQIVNVTWYIDSVEMFNETNVTTSSYSNNTTLKDTYNVTAYVENLNGSRQQVWDWTVTTDWSDWIGTLLQHGDVKLRIPPNNTNGLVSYWSFEAQTDNTAYDVWINNSNDGTFTDGVTGNWTASGKYGGAWIGDGVNDYIDAGKDISLNITDTITMEAWINLTELPSVSGETKVLLGKSDGSLGYRIILDVGTDTLRCQLLGLTDTYPSGTGTPLTVGNYTHIAITYDGSYIKTYVNGILDISDDSSGNISIYSGIFRIGSAAGAASVFNGSIDEVYIYNRALTNDEINESMNNYHTFVSYRNNSVVQDFTIGLVGKYLNISGTHAANVTISATAKFSSDNITWTGDTSINSSFSLNDNVTVSLANEYRYWNDINITLTTTYQPETDIISSITITSAEPSIPTIINYTPVTPIRSHEGDNQTFSITVNQIVNVTWYIDSVEMFNETNVTTSSYSNNTTLEGTYNVTAYVENLNGSRQQVWDWIVKVPDRIPLSIFMGIGGLIVILLGYTLYGVGIPAIFTALLGAMMAFINSQIAINGSLVQNIGGIDNSGNIVQGYTILEIPMLSYLFLFVGLIMVGLTIYHISKELKYIKDSKLIPVEF